MRIVLGIVGALLLVVVVLLGGVMAASELGGEVVVLRTQDAGGEPVETRLWVVDHEGAQWLRAGMPDSGWLTRLEAQPMVEVVRAGRTGRYRAVPVREPAVRDRIHALMAEKYGLGDRLVSLMRDGSASVPVRLDPVSTE